MLSLRLAIIGPCRLIRTALSHLLSSSKGVHVVLDSHTALHDPETLRKLRVDVLLVNSSDPRHDLKQVRQLMSLVPEIRAVLLADNIDEDLESEALRAGAWGCVSRDASSETLMKAVRIVGGGEMWLSHRAATRMIGKLVRWQQAEDRNPNELTPREWEILALVANGCRNKEIASRLFISENTIKTHLNTIFRKLNVNNRLAASLHYFQHASKKDTPAGVAPAAPAKSRRATTRTSREHHRPAV